VRSCADAIPLGHFEMTWRGAVGERGEVQQTVEYRRPASSGAAAPAPPVHGQPPEGSAHQEEDSVTSAGMHNVAAAAASVVAQLRQPVVLKVNGLPAGSGGVRSGAVAEVTLTAENNSGASMELLLEPIDRARKQPARTDAASADGPSGPGAHGQEHAPSSHDVKLSEALGRLGVGDTPEATQEAATAMVRAAIANYEHSGGGDGGVPVPSPSAPSWFGTSPIVLGQVASCARTSASVQFYFPCVGEHALPPLVVTDAISGASFKFSDYGHVCVFE
jgi:hypothetical protein